MIRTLVVLSLLVLPLSAGAHPARSPVGQTLSVVSLPGGTAPRQSLQLNADGSARGFGGCNSFRTSYTRSDRSLRFGGLRATRRFCSGAISKAEQRFFRAIGNTEAYALVGHDGGLQLLDGKGAVLVTLQPQR
ncbi:MAG: META domain-containing protein [Pseudomonadota bacterium]